VLFRRYSSKNQGQKIETDYSAQEGDRGII